MAVPRPRPPTGNLLRVYAFALTVTIGATVLRALIDPWAEDRLPFITYFAAVALAGWYGGLGPALVATALGFLGAAYFFVPPRDSFAVEDPSHWIGLAMFAAMGAVIAAFAGAIRRALVESAARRDALHTTLASIGDGVIATDAEGRVTFLNPIAVQLTGWPLAEARGRLLGEVFVIVNEDTREPVENPALRALRDGTIVGLANHTLLVRRDGVATPIDDSAAPIRDGEGQITGAVLVFRDVATRRLADNALRASEARNAAVVQSALDGLVVMDADGCIVDFNPAAERMFGWQRADVMGRTVAETLVPPSLRAAHIAGLRRHLEEGRERVLGRRLEMPALRADGSEITVELSIRAARVEGQAPFFTAFVRDITDRNRAHEAQAALAAIVVASDDAIVSKTLEGIVQSWNAGAERIFGWTAAEMVGQSITRIIPAELQGEEVEILERLRRGERIDHFQTVRVAKSGRRVEVAVTISPIHDRAGRIIGASKVARDITAQKVSDRLLQQGEERYRRLVGLLPIAVYTCDAPSGVITFHNPHAAALWGRAPAVGETDEELSASLRLGRTDGTPLPPAATPMAVALRDGRSCRNEEVVIERADGSRITVLVNIEPILDDRGKVVGAVNAFHDTTALLRAQEALRASDDAFRSLVAVITDVPFHADANGLVAAPMPTWATFTGQTWEQYRGEGWFAALHSDDREAAAAMWVTACRERVPYHARFRLWHAASREHRHVEARATPLFEPNGDLRGWIGACTDVHAQTVAKQELLLADRRKDEFLATLAHELRNPLAPVRNSIEIMKRANGDHAIVAAAHQTMDRHVRLMERLMDDLLDVSRITRNRLELRRAPTELGAVVQQAVEACRPLCAAAGQQLTVQLPEQPVWLHADGMRLVQVFSNLLNNASKYSEPGGHIRLDAECTAAEVVVAVQDDGVGIPPAMLPHVFEMFTQVDGSLERSRGGLGIGLTLVKQIVELHQGSVTARSGGAGRGSEFVVRLPIGSPAAPDNVENRPTPGGTNAATAQPRRVLVVDDNQDAATTLAMLLRLSGDDVHVAHDGEEALAMAATLRPDVLLLDLGLPKRNGYEVCKALREQPWARDLTIIAISGWGQVEDRRRTESAGFDGHLVKPIDYPALEILVARPRERA